MAAGRFFLGRSRGAAACSPPRSRSRSTACPPLPFWAAVVAGGSRARGWRFGSWLVPCLSGEVVALLGSLVATAWAGLCWARVLGSAVRVCSVHSSALPVGVPYFAALVALRAWRPCPAWRGMCAHAECPGGVPHARSVTRSFSMCMFDLASCFFIFMFSDLALLCFSKRLGPRSAGGAWGPHIFAVVRSGVPQPLSHARVGMWRGGTADTQRQFNRPSARLLRCSPTAPPRQWGCGGVLAA